MANILNTKKLMEALQAAGIPVVGAASTGRIDFADGVTDQQKQDALAILEQIKNPPVFTGVEVFDATDVDHLTIARILEVMRPGAPADLQAGAEMRQVKNILAGLLLVVGYLTQVNGQPLPPDVSAVFAQLGDAQALNAKVESIRQEGIDFKKTQGWQ